ncbi:MAG: hypothetical protein ACOC1Q_01935 [Desulfosalsimonas sp.]
MKRPDNSRFFKVDRSISKKTEEIFADPSRHKFVSEYDVMHNNPVFAGPRGGKPRRARKTICFFCSCKRAIHAKTTEKL